MKISKSGLRDNSGASAIMFAMFFVIIISLITIGFATLARRDQRATLDKTISAQAQLLTESAVNSVKQYYANVANPKTNNDCIPTNADNPGYIAPVFDNGDKITCLTWTDSPTEATFNLLPYDSASFTQVSPTGATRLTWKTNGVAAGALYGQLTNNQLPTIVDNKKSIIKMVTVNRDDVYALNTLSKVKVIYLVPYNGADVSPSKVLSTASDLGNDYVELGNQNNGSLQTEASNGLVYYVPCVADTCTVTIGGYAYRNADSTFGDRLNYFMPIGTEETVLQFEALDTYGGTAQPLSGVQIKIDATAISQEQVKRLIAYIPAKPDTDVWKPFFGALADGLCKDVKIDSTNNLSTTGGPACL